MPTALTLVLVALPALIIIGALLLADIMGERACARENASLQAQYERESADALSAGTRPVFPPNVLRRI